MDMNKLKTFFYVFKNSIASPKYYNDILKTNIGFSIKYFVLLSFFASLIFSAVFSIRGIPETKEYIGTLTEQIKDAYPNDFVLDFKDGTWKINQEEPYIIPTPEFLKFDTETNQIPQSNLIVFDKKGTIENLETYNTLSILNEANFVYRDQGGKITAQPIKNVPNFTLDKTTLTSKLDDSNRYLKTIPYLIPLFIFTFNFVFIYLGEGAFNIFLAGFMIYLLSFIRKEKISYKSACQIVIHTMTVPILARLVLGFTKYSVSVYDWLFVLNVLIAAVFMVRMKEDSDIKKIEKEDNIN